MWTWFRHNGCCGARLPARDVFVEASKTKALKVFKRLFGCDPQRRNLNCDCGPGYAVEEHPTLEQASSRVRGVGRPFFENGYVDITPLGSMEPVRLFDEPPLTVDALESRSDVRIVRASEVRELTP